MAQKSLTQYGTAAETPEKADTHSEESPAEKLSRIKEELAEVRDELGREDEMDGEELAAAEKELKDLEDEVEDTRKETVEPQLDELMDVGDSQFGLRRQQGHRKFLFDAVESLSTLEANGIDIREVTKPKPNKVKKALESVGIDSEKHVGENEYDYYVSK